MKLDLFLFKKSFWVFIVFFVLVIWAFSPGYFTPVWNRQVVEPLYHTHGIAMTLWVLMLITQAYLIRINKRSWHSMLGKFSYLLMPFMLFATLQLVHHIMKDNNQWSNIQLFNLALMVNASVVLAILYGLAIYHRKKPLLHARYMVCTIFPLFTPVTDRLIHRHFRELIAWMPTIDGIPIVPTFGFVLADLILLIFIIWDWRVHQRKDAFLISFILLLCYHISTMTFYHFAWWRAFGEWFVGIG